jgi:DNA primase
MANHPAILHEHFDEFAALDLSDRQLDSLRGLILEVAASDPGIDAAGMRRILGERGCGPLLDRLDVLAERGGHWQALATADDRDAAQGWLQAMILHRKARTLHKELKDAELALAVEPSDANLARMIEIQNQLSSAEGTEAAVEGFGALSGRQSGSL